MTDWKGDSYNSILVIVDRLIKMVHYEPVKVTINALGLVEVIIDVVVRHHGFSDSIITNWRSFSPRSSGHCYAISSASSRDSLPPSTHRRMVRPKSKIKQWKPTFKPLLTLSRMIGHSFFPWRSLPITTPRMPVPATHFLSSIADITFGFLKKKT